MESQLLGWLAMLGTVAVALPEAFSEHLEDSVNQICAAASVYCCSIGLPDAVNCSSAACAPDRSWYWRTGYHNRSSTGLPEAAVVAAAVVGVVVAAVEGQRRRRLLQPQLELETAAEAVD